jgi:hypothetical protein
MYVRGGWLVRGALRLAPRRLVLHNEVISAQVLGLERRGSSPALLLFR